MTEEPMGTIVNIDMENPDDYKQKSFTPIEPGMRDFEICNELRQTVSQKGNPMIKVEFKCITEDDELGKKVFETLTLTKKAYFRFYQFCRALGFEDDSIKAGIDISQLHGMQLTATTRQETYQKTDPLTNETKTKIASRIDEYHWKGKEEETETA